MSRKANPERIIIHVVTRPENDLSAFRNLPPLKTSTRGRITIPKRLRTALNLKQGDKVDFGMMGKDIVMWRVGDEALIQHLLDPLFPQP